MNFISEQMRFDFEFRACTSLYPGILIKLKIMVYDHILIWNDANVCYIEKERQQKCETATKIAFAAELLNGSQCEPAHL